MDIKNNKKNIVKILSLFLIVLTLIAGTFAYIKWSSGNDGSKVMFYTGDGFTCSADGGGDFSESDLDIMDGVDNAVFMPISSCLNEEHVYKRTITATPEIFRSGLAIQMNLWFEISELSSSFVNNSNLKYVVTTSDTNCESGTTIASGDFGEVSAGSKIDLLKNKVYSGEGAFEETYYLYIWLDAAETNPDTAGSEFRLLLDGECSKYESPIGAPVLDDGMIPVTIDNDGTVNVVSEYDSSWYNYDEKRWANVVLVNTDSRSNYLNTPGETVDPDDILAYYVWIPRYKYKLFTNPPVASSDTNTPTSIDIVFESKYDEYSYGENVGEYYTHPAFWWDTNNNGDIDIDLTNNETEMLAGIWVGKFETALHSYDDEDIPYIRPDDVPSIGSDVITQFETSLMFSGGEFSGGDVTFSGNDTYGLTKYTDSHMMKNSEWGAVAYLSHSKYGINGEVHSNPHDLQTNGCGTFDVIGSMSSDCDIPYGGASSYPQSTTGNITGVFDMSGGESEAVMAVLGYYEDEEVIHYTGLTNFNGLDAEGSFIDDGNAFPDKRYYDLYLNDWNSCDVVTRTSFDVSSGILLEDYTIPCFGHALYETFNWYDYFGQYVNDLDSWLARGYYYFDGNDIGEKYGIFNFSNHHGDGSEQYFDYTWRSVLVTG